MMIRNGLSSVRVAVPIQSAISPGMGISFMNDGHATVTQRRHGGNGGLRMSSCPCPSEGGTASGARSRGEGGVGGILVGPQALCSERGGREVGCPEDRVRGKVQCSRPDPGEFGGVVVDPGADLGGGPQVNGCLEETKGQA